MESCKSLVNNRFKLVVLASQRAHDLSSGATPSVERKKNKNTVLALIEIAEKKLDLPSLFNLVVHRCKKYVENFGSISDLKAGSISDDSEIFASIESEIEDETDSKSDFEATDDELIDVDENEFISDNEMLKDMSFSQDNVDEDD